MKIMADFKEIEYTFCIGMGAISRGMYMSDSMVIELIQDVRIIAREYIERMLDSDYSDYLDSEIEELAKMINDDAGVIRRGLLESFDVSGSTAFEMMTDIRNSELENEDLREWNYVVV